MRALRRGGYAGAALGRISSGRVDGVCVNARGMASAVDASAADASRRRLTLTAVSVVGTLVFGRMRRKFVDSGG